MALSINCRISLLLLFARKHHLTYKDELCVVEHFALSRRQAFSLSRAASVRTTSATSKMSPVFIFSRFSRYRLFQLSRIPRRHGHAASDHFFAGFVFNDVPHSSFFDLLNGYQYLYSAHGKAQDIILVGLPRISRSSIASIMPAPCIGYDLVANAIHPLRPSHDLRLQPTL